jgi:hypothetical protein
MMLGNRQPFKLGESVRIEIAPRLTNKILELGLLVGQTVRRRRRRRPIAGMRSKAASPCPLKSQVPSALTDAKSRKPSHA